jgi:hypothetical protein
VSISVREVQKRYLIRNSSTDSGRKRGGADTTEYSNTTAKKPIPISKRVGKKSAEKRAHAASAQLDRFHQSRTSVSSPTIDTSAFQVIQGSTDILWRSRQQGASPATPYFITGTSYTDVSPAPCDVLPDQRHPIWKQHIQKPEYSLKPTKAESVREDESHSSDESESGSDHAMDVDDEDFYYTSPSTSEMSLMEVDQETAPIPNIASRAVRYPVLDREWQAGIPHRVAASFCRMVSLRRILPYG